MSFAGGLPLWFHSNVESLEMVNASHSMVNESGVDDDDIRTDEFGAH
jgi:hypothetical protein